jgi:hypothetical protein
MKALVKLIFIIIVGLITYQLYDILKDPNAKNISSDNLSAFTVKEIIDNPSAFNKPIQVVGEVNESVNVLGIKYLKLNDFEYFDKQLLVIPHSEIVPKKGTPLRVQGYVKQLLKLGDVEWVVFKDFQN